MFAGEGNFYLSDSCMVNSDISKTQITKSVITASTLDMLSSSGNFQRITNVATPILDNDTAIKSYVDNFGISTVTLTNTTGSQISSVLSGSFIITIKNQILNGPSGVFIVSKNEPDICGHVTRQAAVPGTGTMTGLKLTWPISTGLILSKTGTQYNGDYQVKII